MRSTNGVRRFFIFLAVTLAQVIMTQLVTFVISVFLPNMGDFPQTRPVLCISLLGVSYTIGIFFIGWLALNRRWLALVPRYPARLVATLLGAYLPLVIAVLVYRPLEPGNPFFFVAILTGILGFHLPGFFTKK